MDKFRLLIDKFNLIQKVSNDIETNINRMKSRTENIITENARTNEILKFDGTNWIPSNEIGADGGQSLAYKTSAASSAADATAAASEAIGSRDSAAVSTLAAEAAAVAAESEADSAAAGENSAVVSANDALTLINSKANSDNPFFTGTVNLPYGTTINGEPIILSHNNNNKIISRVYREGADAQPDYATDGTNNYDIVSVRFQTVDINTYNVPTLGNSGNIESGSTTLWHNETDPRGQLRTCFTVPPARTGIYRILTNITGQFGIYNGSGRSMIVFIYRKRDGIERCISYNQIDNRNSGDNYGSLLQEFTSVTDQMFELNEHDQIFIEVQAITPYGDSSEHAFRLIAESSDLTSLTSDPHPGAMTNLTIMEM